MACCIYNKYNYDYLDLSINFLEGDQTLTHPKVKTGLGKSDKLTVNRKYFHFKHAQFTVTKRPVKQVSFGTISSSRSILLLLQFTTTVH